MKLKRVVDLPTLKQMKNIYYKISKGRLKYYEDELGYAMFDEDELARLVPAKRGRKSKQSK